MAANDVYKVELHWLVGETKCMNVLHFKQQDADSGENPLDKLAAGVLDHLQTDLMPLVGTQTILTDITVKGISPTITNVRVYGVSGWMPGGTGSLPPAANITASFYTAEFTKRGRGRMRIVGLGKDQIDDINLSPTASAGLDTFLLNILSVWNAAGSAIHFAGYVWSTIDSAARAISHAKVHPNIRSLRSRRK